MRKVRLMLAPLVVAAAAALAGCGGSSSTTSTSTTSTTNASTTTSSTGGSPLGGSSALSSKFCDLVKKDNKAFSENITFADAKQKMPVAKAAIDELTAAAPLQIKSDLQTLDRVLTVFNDAAKSAHSQQELKAKAGALQAQNGAFEGAWAKVDTFTKQQCGISFGAGS